MNFDKNTVIGFSLLGLLFFGYFYYNSIGQKEIELQRKRVADSLALIEKKTSNRVGDRNLKMNNKSTAILAPATSEMKAVAADITIIETKDYTITFSNQGGLPIRYDLKHISSFNQPQATLINNKSFSFFYPIVTENNVEKNTNDIVFNKPTIVRNADSSQQITFTYTSKNNTLQHIYTLPRDGYLFDFIIKTNSGNTLFKDAKIHFNWLSSLQQHEKNLDYEKTQAQVSIFTNEKDFDYFTVGNGSNETFEKPLKWVSIKQQFFNHTLIAKNNLENVKNESVIYTDTTQAYFLSNKTNFTASLSSNNDLAFQFYYGPTSYKDLKQYNIELERIMNIGQGFYSFVKYVNKGVVIPVFNFLKSHIANFGIVILLLTIFLRLITAPLLYSSYTSSAKMKILKPELDELKKKFGDDQQGYAMKQMELYRTAGVNPLGGCIPALLQIPIFLSLYYFFNSCIDLRGQQFLWAKDLSSFDSIYQFGFSIPFYGDHISLFTILNVITSFLISYMGMKNTPDQGNPMLKYMPYIFPFILLGFFNSLPSSLTWYYTASNTITLLLQFIIQNYIINHDKLLAQMEAKRKAPKQKSSWMQKIEQLQETQKKAKGLPNKK